VPEICVATGSGAGPDAGAALDAALRSVAAGLVDAGDPDLAVLFLGGAHADEAEQLAAGIRDRLRPRHLLGVSAGGVVADGAELERPDGLSLWAAVLPGARLTPLRYEAPRAAVPGARAGVAWPEPPEDTAALILLADPASFPAPAFLAWVDQTRPGLPVTGGMASAGLRVLLLDDEVVRDGAVGLAVGGDVQVRALVSQGCRPIGQSYAVTRADRNLLQELGGAPPIERIRETFSEAEHEDRELMRQGLHIGVVVDEYQDEYGTGDFLVRGVMGAQTGTGALAIGDVVRIGQTVQFHVRDAASADADLRAVLARFVPPAGSVPAGALLFTCNGRGRGLFDEPDHDADLLRRTLGEVPVAGFFCAGEFGPLGRRSWVHTFTASALVLLRSDA
jgi:small ligand-binding sensory domain FIST